MKTLVDLGELHLILCIRIAYDCANEKKKSRKKMRKALVHKGYAPVDNYVENVNNYL